MGKAHEIIDATGGRDVLFFDLAEVDHVQHVQRSVCQAKKHPHNPVLDVADKNAWDSGWVAPWAVRGAVYDEDDGLFKIWYGAQQYGDGPGAMGIAVSRDGVVWQRPRVGLYENGGNKDNNIVHDIQWGCIIKDPAEPDPARRFKLTVTRNNAFSPDGMHWTAWHPIERNFSHKVADTVAFVRDEQDPRPDRRYKYVFQYYDRPNKPGPEEVRFKGIAFSPDGVNWTESKDNPILCPNDSFENENHFLAYVPYKGHWLLLYECAWYHPDGTGRFGRYVGDVRLAHSRDGEHFARLNNHQAVLPHGNPQDWDGQFVVITDKVIVKDDTIYLYYSGMGTEWTSWPPQNLAPGTRLVDPQTKKGATGKYSLRRMGLATLRLDGFTCMHVADGTSLGHFTTRPIKLGDSPRTGLSINLGDTRAGWSWLEVEVLDAGTGEVLPGFSRGQCGPIIQDAVRVGVRWGERTLAELRGRTVRLRFNLVGSARLYSFRIGEPGSAD